MMILLIYFAVTLSTLIALAAMILAIARALADCPEKGPRARAAGLSVAAGYLAIGGGGVLLIATLIGAGPQLPMLIFAMGLACVMLGLGFAQAVTTLRAVLDPRQPASAKPIAQNAAVPMEPVLS